MQRTPAMEDRATQFATKRKALNDQFTSWVKAQQELRPDESWADEARQFLAYVAQLKEEYADVLSAPAEPVAKPPQAFPASSPAPSPAAAPKPVVSAPASVPPFSAAPPPAASPFFAPPPSAPGGFSFLGGAAPPLGGGSNPFAALQPAAAAADEAEDDEPERPPSPSVHKSSAEDDGEQVAFESKCKLFFRGQDNAWSPRGMGNLQLRRPLDASAAASARLILRNDTGKAMLNAKLYSGMKLIIKDGKSLCTTVFNSVAPSATTGEAEPDASSKAVMTMLRFKSNEDAAKLKQLMDACLAK